MVEAKEFQQMERSSCNKPQTEKKGFYGIYSNNNKNKQTKPNKPRSKQPNQQTNK